MEKHSTALSFRDPSGSVIATRNLVLRIVHEPCVQTLFSFLQSDTATRLVADKTLISSRIVDPKEWAQLELYSTPQGAVVLEHERVFFPSFPYEWAPEMLFEAANLTLSLAQTILQKDFILKDASPYNVLFQGIKPVFIDLTSFEPRNQNMSVWIPYAQFIRTFLLPLLANRTLGLPLNQLLFSRRDGIEPSEFYRWISFFQRLLPPFLTLVTLPTWLENSKGKNKNPFGGAIQNPEKTKFILESIFQSLKKTLANLKPKTQVSHWAHYAKDNSYQTEEAKKKSNFLDRFLRTKKPKNILDIGCNTGQFSIQAASIGCRVIAIDSDPVVIGKLFAVAKNQSLDILPLCIDFSRPTPAVGWNNLECPSFIDRAKDKFDCVLMLAVIHHLLIRERIPLAQICELAHELTTDTLIAEFVSQTDPMFKVLSRGQESLYLDYSREFFESTFLRFFSIAYVEEISVGKRWIYEFKKGPASNES